MASTSEASLHAEALLEALASAPRPEEHSAGDIVLAVLRSLREYDTVHGASAVDGMRRKAPCDVTQCKGERVEVRLAPGAHYCTRFCVAHEGTAGTPHSTLYWCALHRRMHACTGVCEKTVYTDALGNKVCVLSGRVVGAAMAHSFGDGTVPESALAPEASSRSANRAPRRGSVRDLLRQTAVGAGAGVAASPAPAAPASAAEVEYDPDCPRKGLFGNAYAENSIGDNIGDTLDEMYAQAWGTVHLLLFSPEREADEVERAAAALREAAKRVLSYVKDALRSAQVVQLDRSMQYHDRALSHAMTACPGLMLPPGATRRYTAYYAMAVLVRYLQLMEIADAVVARTKAGRIRKMVARLRTYSQADVFPTVLEMLRDEAERQDWFLAAVFPEPHTVERLGITQHTCTEVSKRFKQVLMRAHTLGIAAPPRVVRVDEDELRYGRGVDFSVVARFIELRLAMG